MKMRHIPVLKSVFMKWLFASVLVFVISLTANSKLCFAASTYTVNVSKGYLALRSDKSYNPANEIGQLYTGDTVDVYDTSYAYWYVYSPKLNKYGYVDKDYLVSSASTVSYRDVRTVNVAKGYLALRTAKKYDSSNEIGQLYNGDSVEVCDSSDAAYWYVYAPKLGKFGYVNKDYLSSPIGMASTTCAASYNNTRTVSVAKGYLALRTAKKYDSSNEIGELYTGDIVNVYDFSDATYWYVYAPKLGKSGYVNKDYLVGSNPVNMKTVKVSKGYLALRTAKAYDSSNEIGKLYSGDYVQVCDSGDAAYWYVYAPKLGLYGYVNKDYLY